VTRLILWRHGQTAWNADGRVQGQTDVPLADLGRVQAAEAAERLAELGPDLLVASDLSRAAETAAVLSERTGLKVRHDTRLRERDFGQWQGLLLSEAAARWPAAFERWRAGKPVGEAGIEDLDSLAERVRTALEEAVAEVPDDATVVVATHGGAAKHGTGALLGWPERVVRQFGGLDNCRWTALRHSQRRGWSLTAHNV
jgi:broad specificity phosphatase PhoE